VNVLAVLDAYGMRDDQLWYVAHPVHPTEEEITEGMRRLRGYVGGSPGEREHREIAEEVIRANIANAKLWLAWLVRRFPRISFIAPWIPALDGGGDDDLDPAVRARGAGKALIDWLVAEAKRKGWSRLYWHTRNNNYRARGLYDKFTPHSDFVRYTVYSEES